MLRSPKDKIIKLSEKLDILEIKLRQYIQYNALVKQENAALTQQIQKLKIWMQNLVNMKTQLSNMLKVSMSTRLEANRLKCPQNISLYPA